MLTCVPLLPINSDMAQGYPPINFDVTHPDGSGPNNLNVNVRTNEHTSLVREIGGASTVLLKNANNVLPLNLGRIKTMAVIGLDAQTPDPNCNLNECDTGVITIGCANRPTQFSTLNILISTR